MEYADDYSNMCSSTCYSIPVTFPDNDFRPVALTSVVMKYLEKIVLHNLIQPIQERIDTCQFAYQRNKSAQDAVLSLTQAIYQHLDKKQCYAKALFIDFSSAFNTIQPFRLLEKLKFLDVKPSLILWICDFLSARIQRVKVNGTLLDPIVTNTGSPQGCVMSPSLFIIYTNDCVSNFYSVNLLKYADDTVIEYGLIMMNTIIGNRYRISVYVVKIIILNLTLTKQKWCLTLGTRRRIVLWRTQSVLPG